jgi:hypothetical protein
VEQGGLPVNEQQVQLIGATVVVLVAARVFVADGRHLAKQRWSPGKQDSSADAYRLILRGFHGEST